MFCSGKIDKSQRKKFDSDWHQFVQAFIKNQWFSYQLNKSVKIDRTSHLQLSHEEMYAFLSRYFVWARDITKKRPMETRQLIISKEIQTHAQKFREGHDELFQLKEHYAFCATECLEILYEGITLFYYNTSHKSDNLVKNMPQIFILEIPQHSSYSLRSFPLLFLNFQCEKKTR